MLTVPASPCPTCQRPRDGKLRCWNCCDRACEQCGLSTGSAFVATCILCAGMAPDPPTPRPEVWVIVVEAEVGPVPVAVRVRQLVKHAWRRHGLKCAGLRDPGHLAATVDISEVVTEEETT